MSEGRIAAKIHCKTTLTIMTNGISIKGEGNEPPKNRNSSMIERFLIDCSKTKSKPITHQ